MAGTLFRLRPDPSTMLIRALGDKPLRDEMCQVTRDTRDRDQMKMPDS